MLLAAAAAGFLCATLPPLSARAADEKLKEGDLVAICGDSITEGKVYSVFMADYLLMCQPTANVNSFQVGWAGEKADGLLNRLKTNVLAFSPTVATTCYGMNDGGYKATSPENTAAYKKNMTAIVKRLKEDGVRFIVVGSPGVVDTSTYKGRPTTPEIYNETLRNLANAAREVATEEGVAFADVNTVMMEAMTRAKELKGKDFQVAGNDGVHPGSNGHLAMAYAFLKGLGFDGNIGTITVDLKAGTAEGSDGHKVLSSSGNKTEVQSTRYPFCFARPDGTPVDAASMLPFLPFHQDLNRYMLVVKNPPENLASLKVTWGPRTKMFSIADLAKGVNLAAEFPQNPFCEPFFKVHNLVREQQNAETTGIKNMIGTISQLKAFYGDDQDAANALKLLGDKIPDRLKAYREASSAAVIPVRHAIIIETN
ncbi:MAG: SGNH/GDSL hydrolase family protein [Candidatus Methylacidiphilales bacterium]|nr:SGNH/GDSL hydrolase family protein [Candidatus Methylacidiphilales bacterium]